MRAYERLLKYAVIRTPSDEFSESAPSSACQFELAELLVKELQELGLSDAEADEYCYVYAHLPATAGMEDRKCMGLIAHIDTVSDFCGHDITPVITPEYDGKGLPLGTSGRILSPSMFPHLKSLKGQTLITTDGTTVLGADDKAGVAEIITLLERLIREQIPHGPIAVAFTPDEEIGMGTAHFNLEKMKADYAYTLDGDTEGEIQFENFNACSAYVTVKGVNVHPGSAKNTMVNASLAAMEFNSMLPSGDTPANTDDYEGFFHLLSMEGDVAEAKLHYIIRDHDAAAFDFRQNTMKHITSVLNEKWGSKTVSLELKQEYRNMTEIIQEYPYLIEQAKNACETAGITPLILPIRGGTDGAHLSYMGLPCPNLGTGGHAYHGPFEHITIESMDKVVEMLIALVKIAR